jgi:uncharacterized membrane protein
MWLLGLIVGGFIGAVGGFGGAFLGAIVGLAVGIAASRKAPAEDPGWKRDVDQALAQLQRRIDALERGVAPAAAEAPPPALTPEPVQQPEPAVDPVARISVLAGNEPMPAAVAAAPAPEMSPVAEPQPGGAGTAPPAKAPPDNAFTRWFFGGNTLVRVGVIVLFFGVAFLLKFAADRGFVPIELRLAGVAFGGIALLVVGWRLRGARAGYALMLQGAGIGVLYLTVFAALRLYRLLPAELAFALLAGIAVFSAVMAVLQNSRSLAITGAAGGFLAPILASTGGGSHVALFSFYAVLNAGILGIAYYKAWRELNLVGFAFTFVIGLLWGAKYYRPELFSTTAPFLVLFFVFYVSIAVLFARRQAPRLAHYVDGTLVFGTPLIAFGLQTALVRHMEFGAAWSAFAVSAFYLALATVLHARGRETLRLLVESFLALGVGFATLAVPLAFDGRWTSAVWAVEGAAILWVGVRQGRMLPRVFAMLLQVAGGIAFLVGADNPYGATPVLNSFLLGCVMVSGAGLFCSYYLERNRETISPAELIAGRLLFVWGALWWFAGGIAEIHRHAPAQWGRHPHLVFFAASCAAFGGLWRKLDWDAARFAALSILPWMVLTAIVLVPGVGWHRHPFAHHAYLGWALGFAVHLWLLRAHEGRAAAWPGRFHAAGFWLLGFLLSWEVGWQIDRYVDGQRVWPLIAWALVPGALIAVFAARGDRLGWPVSSHRRAYLYAGALPLALFLLLWMLYANFASNGNPAPLPYVPLLNPLDIAQAAALLALVTWFIGVKRLDLPDTWLPSASAALKILGMVAFIVLNGVLLRTLHHYADVPFRLDAMWRSMLVQAAFSLFWSLLALAAMVIATRRTLRPLWVVGAALLGVVVAKLFLVDLASTGTVERVVSFISVGVLVIVVGYFAPVPPKSQEKTA